MGADEEIGHQQQRNDDESIFHQHIYSIPLRFTRVFSPMSLS
jgi:hypothetical protein